MNLIPLNIRGISYSHTQNGAYALILNEINGQRKLPIVIGAFEAQSIAMAVEKDLKPSRPLTHDLFKDFADAFSIQIKKVIIHKLIDGVFYAYLVCVKNVEEKIIDARTSDAVSLAIRFNASIFTYASILEKAGVILQSEQNETDLSDTQEDLNEILEDFLNFSLPDEQKTTNPYEEFTKTELEKLLDKSIALEDYQKAAEIRDELSKRNQQ